MNTFEASMVVISFVGVVGGMLRLQDDQVVLGPALILVAAFCAIMWLSGTWTA